MPMTPELRRGIDRIRDYLFGGGYPNPAQNAEQLSFLIYFYMYETADAARVRAAQRPGAARYAGAFEGDWNLRDPRNARDPGVGTCPREFLRWSSWAHALNGERLVNWVREEVFPFHAELAANGVTDFMDGARLVIDEPTVLTQVVSQLNDLHLDRVDADTKGDLFEHRSGRRASSASSARRATSSGRWSVSSIPASGRPSTTRRRGQRASWSARGTIFGSPIPRLRGSRKSTQRARPSGAASATR